MSPLGRSDNRGLRQTLPALAAVFREIREQIVHCGIVRHVIDEAAFLAPADQADPAEVGKMKRERRRRNREFLADRARTYTPRSGLHQQSEYGQSRFMPKGGQAARGDVYFHVSSIVELIDAVNRFHEKGISAKLHTGSITHRFCIASSNTTLPVTLHRHRAMYNSRSLALPSSTRVARFLFLACRAFACESH